jgi:hypothetical protein
MILSFYLFIFLSFYLFIFLSFSSLSFLSFYLPPIHFAEMESHNLAENEGRVPVTANFAGRR